MYAACQRVGHLPIAAFAITHVTVVGFDTDEPLRLLTHCAMQVELADLNGDDCKEVIFSGGDQVQIYWNRNGRITADDRTIIDVEGNSTLFAQGAVRVAVADVDSDGRNELLISTTDGVQIRAASALGQVRQILPLDNCSWLHTADLDGDGRIDVITLDGLGAIETLLCMTVLGALRQRRRGRLS